MSHLEKYRIFKRNNWIIIYGKKIFNLFSSSLKKKLLEFDFIMLVFSWHYINFGISKKIQFSAMFNLERCIVPFSFLNHAGIIFDDFSKQF